MSLSRHVTVLSSQTRILLGAFANVSQLTLKGFFKGAIGEGDIYKCLGLCAICPIIAILGLQMPAIENVDEIKKQFALNST